MRKRLREILPVLAIIIGIVVAIVLAYIVIRKFAFLGAIGVIVVIKLVSFIVDVLDGTVKHEEQQSYTTYDEPKKSRSYREVGLFDYRSDGSTDNCTNCKHYNG